MAKTEAQFSNQYALNTYAVLEATSTQEAASNRSKITWTLSIEVRNWSGYSNNQWIASSSAVVNGSFNNSTISTPVQSYRVYGNASGSGSAVVSSGSFYHSHDSNGNGGTKTLSISIKPNSDHIQNQPTLNLSLNLSLGTINVHKASDFGSYPTSILPNSTYSINITNPNGSMASSYEHNVYISVNSDTRLLGTKYGTGSFTFTIPSSIENSISGTSQSVYLQILTINNGNNLGSTFRTVTITRTTTLRPRITNSGFAHSEGNTIIKNMQLNGYVAGLSKINVNLNDSAVSYPSGGTKSRFNVYLYYGESLIRTETTTGTSVTFNVDSRTTNTTANIKVSATDSKGYTSDLITISNISILGYSAPTAKGTVVRNSTTQTTINLRATYTLTPITISNVVKNKLTIQTQSRAGSASWQTISNLTTTDLTGNGSYNKDIPNVSTASSFEYRLVLTDGLSTVYVVLGSTGTEKVPLDVSKTGIGVGKFHSDGSYDLEVGSGGIHSEGRIVSNPNNAITLDLYGSDHNYLQMFVNGARKAYVGFPASGSQIFTIANEMLGKKIELRSDGLYYDNLKLAKMSDIGNVDLSKYYTKTDADSKFLTSASANNSYMPKSTTIPTATNTKVANGTYFRIGNMQFCMHQLTIANNGQYYYSGSWTFPATFASASEVYCFGSVATVPSASLYQNWNGNVTMYSVSTTGVNMWWAGTHDTKTLSGNVLVNVLSIGRYR